MRLRALRAACWLVMMAAVMWLAGFALFFHALPAHPTDPQSVQAAPPDAIVVLTGPEPARISRGVDLYAAGVAPLLLISGVSPGQDLAHVLRHANRSDLPLPGGVTLGYQAADTVGNANEVAAWICAHGLRRVWLITADYHMPRALWLFRLVTP